MKGVAVSGRVLKNADIIVGEHRIKSVGAKGSAPAGAKVIDVRGKTIVLALSIRTRTGRKIRRASWTRKLGVPRKSGVWRDVGASTYNRDKRHVCISGLFDTGDIIA